MTSQFSTTNRGDPPQQTVEPTITIDPTKVSIQGFLQKKGYFNRYKKRYFCLEKHLLKWGDKEGKPQKVSDLSEGGATRITTNDEKVRNFKIHFYENNKA